MSLMAGLDKLFIKSKEIRYENPSRENPNAREYDACHYEITLDKSLLTDYDPKLIHLQVSVKDSMNVYLYGGESRLEATKSITVGN